MIELLSEPERLLALLCILGLVLGVNAPLLFGMAGRKAFEREAKVWGKVVRPGADVRKRQDAQLDELHERVKQLQADADGDPPPPKR